MELTMMDNRGPPVCSVQMTNGLAATKANMKAVASQLIMEAVVEKYSAAVFATGEYVSHCSRSVLVHSEILVKTHIPTEDDVQNHQLNEAEPPDAVDPVFDWQLLMHSRSLVVRDVSSRCAPQGLCML